MKQKISMLLVLTLFCSLLFAVPAYAVGEGNVDGGGGAMGKEPVKTLGVPEMMVCE